MNNNNKKSMGWNLYEKPVRVRYQITFSYQPGRASVQIQLYQKTFASLAKLSRDTKASCTCPLQHQIFHDYRIFQHFCHMTGFKSINIVLEVVRYNSPDLIRGGTSRENLWRVGYRVRKLKSGTSPGRVYPMQIGKTPQYFQACLREHSDW